MGNELIERVARAIATNKRAPAQRTPEIIDRVWTAYCGQARAAIEAVRAHFDLEGELTQGPQHARQFGYAVAELDAALAEEETA